MRILLVKVLVLALTETGVPVTGDYGHRLTVSGTVPCLPTFVTRWRLPRDSGWNWHRAVASFSQPLGEGNPEDLPPEYILGADFHADRRAEARTIVRTADPNFVPCFAIKRRQVVSVERQCGALNSRPDVHTKDRLCSGDGVGVTPEGDDTSRLSDGRPELLDGAGDHQRGPTDERGRVNVPDQDLFHPVFSHSLRRRSFALFH